MNPEILSPESSSDLWVNFRGLWEQELGVKAATIPVEASAPAPGTAGDRISTCQYVGGHNDRDNWCGSHDGRVSARSVVGSGPRNTARDATNPGEQGASTMTATTENSMKLPIELATLTDQAVVKVRDWLDYAQQESVPNPTAERLAAILQDPNGLEFTVGFVDRVVRTEDIHAAARALNDLGSIAPATMSFIDRAQIQAGSLVGR